MEYSKVAKMRTKARNWGREKSKWDKEEMERGMEEWQQTKKKGMRGYAKGIPYLTLSWLSPVAAKDGGQHILGDRARRDTPSGENLPPPNPYMDF